MSLFGKILDKLGFSAAGAAELPATAPPAAAASQEPRAPGIGQAEVVRVSSQEVRTPAEPQATGVPLVDVMAHLEQLAEANPQKLNWRRSIVDLLKLLGLESDFPTRKAMAVELGCPSNLMQDSAQMNMWLHKTVLRKIAENGGNIPAEMLD